MNPFMETIPEKVERLKRARFIEGFRLQRAKLTNEYIVFGRAYKSWFPEMTAAEAWERFQSDERAAKSLRGDK